MSGSEPIVGENRRIRRTLRDLVALSALPAVWVGLDPERIARGLADVLLATLSLDAVYIRFGDHTQRDFVEVVRSSRGPDPRQEEQLKRALAPLLDAGAADAAASIPDPRGAGELRVAVTRFGLGDEYGVLVACSRDAAFPGEEDRLLLGVGTNQMAIVMQRRQADARMHEQREWLEVTLASIADAVITADIEGRVTFVNRVAEKLTGWSGLDATGQPLQSVFAAIDESTRQPIGNLAHSLRQSDPIAIGVHTMLIARDGTERPIEASAAPIRNASGKAIGAVITFRDVTAQRQAEQARRQGEAALRRSEEHLRAVVANTPACIKVVAGDGTLLDMNPAGLAMVEADSLEAVRGICVYDIVSPEHREAFRAFNERVCRGEDGTLSFEIIGARGTRRRMETLAAPLRRPDGDLAQLAVTVDVTDRERNEQNLKLHARVLDSMVEGVSLCDESGIIIYTNPAEDRIFGYERGELIGQHVSVQNTYPSEENQRIVAEVIACLKRDGSWSGEFRNRKKDGTEFTTHARITAVNAGGKRYFVCV